MLLADVNVLLGALREDAPAHEESIGWLDKVLSGDEAFGVSDLVLVGVVRIATHPRVFRPPTPLGVALEFVETIRSQPHCVVTHPGSRNWEIFADLCRRVDARGNLVTDAYHAALAIESGSEWITRDRDYARFPGLRWRHPAASSR